MQTDNGCEFTKRLANTQNPTPTLFEARLKQCGIRHKLIKPYTPRHNGKVERSHRKDNEYFYATHTFYSFEDFKKQLAVHSRKYNNFPMRPLNWKSPADYINAFISNGEVFWFCNTSLTNLHNSFFTFLLRRKTFRFYDCFLLITTK